jgi:hypothetical protein
MVAMIKRLFDESNRIPDEENNRRFRSVGGSGNEENVTFGTSSSTDATPGHHACNLKVVGECEGCIKGTLI